MIQVVLFKTITAALETLSAALIVLPAFAREVIGLG
jgi:hypothetical protein